MVEDISQIEDTKPCGHCLKKRDLKKIYTAEYERRKRIYEKKEKETIMIDFKYDGKLAKLKAQYEESIIGLSDD